MLRRSLAVSADSVQPLSRRTAWHAALTCVAAACALAGCQRVTPAAPPTPQAAVAPAAAEAAAVPAAYTAPSAQALYQMVAPIALYPDKLVAQVLAGATYPDQISAAETWLGQNPGMKGAALVSAADAQPWDPSVKSLTAFPNVLEQMASNLPWTTALGKAYYHDPSDVMNAIQAMRARAAHAGTLKSSPRLRVATVAASTLAPPPPPVRQPVAVYQGPAVVPVPASVITIEPAQPQTVYVPRYDPAVVYGAPVPVYPSYRWAVPLAPSVPAVAVAAGPDPWAVGALAFGAGVVVTALVNHHHAWGWDAWDLHWGAPPPPPAVAWGPAPPPPRAWGPAVVYRGNTYVSNSTTVVENVHNRITVNNTRNVYVNAPGQPAAPALPVPAMAQAAGPGGAQQAALAPSHAVAAAVRPAALPVPGVPPQAAALQGGHGNAPRFFAGEQGARPFVSSMGNHPAAHPAAPTPAPGADRAVAGHAALQAALARPDGAAPDRSAMRPRPALLQTRPDEHASRAMAPPPAQGHHPDEAPNAAAQRGGAPGDRVAREEREASRFSRPPEDLGAARSAALEPAAARMAAAPQRAPWPSEAAARARPPEHAMPAARAAQPPAAAEPRGMAAAHAAQPPLPHAAPHEVRPQPRPAPQPQPQHNQPPRGQEHEREHRPHGEHHG